jgi:hypothetical protein
MMPSNILLVPFFVFFSYPPLLRYPLTLASRDLNPVTSGISLFVDLYFMARLLHYTDVSCATMKRQTVEVSKPFYTNPGTRTLWLSFLFV